MKINSSRTATLIVSVCAMLSVAQLAHAASSNFQEQCEEVVQAQTAAVKAEDDRIDKEHEELTQKQQNMRKCMFDFSAIAGRDIVRGDTSGILDLINSMLGGDKCDVFQENIHTAFGGKEFQQPIPAFNQPSSFRSTSNGATGNTTAQDALKNMLDAQRKTLK